MIYACVPRQHSLYTMWVAIPDLYRQNVVLYPDLQTIGKHCKFGYETRFYIALLKPIIMFDIIYVI